jgi:hypothetical protein
MASLRKEPHDKGVRTTHAVSTGRCQLAPQRHDRVGKGHLDIMTSDSGKLTPDCMRVRLRHISTT